MERRQAGELTEQALDRINDPTGEGSRTFLKVHDAAALAAADASDKLRESGVIPSPLSGIPISLKDLFDEQGQQTRAGSKSLEDVSPAAKDSTATSRLRASGAVLVGRTNLTEFAYSGLGLNTHWEPPAIHGTAKRSEFREALLPVPGSQSRMECAV